MSSGSDIYDMNEGFITFDVKLFHKFYIIQTLNRKSIMKAGATKEFPIEDARITWDTTVYTDRKLQHNRPVTQESTLIDKAVPAGQDIIKAEDGKLTKYQSLAIKINRQHRALKVTVIPIVIGALGTISKNAKDLS
eukprot:gene10290-18988_t